MRRHILQSPSQKGDLPITQLAIEEAPAGWVWQTQQQLLITDVDAYESRYRKVVAEMREHGVKTAYYLPLTSLGRRLGALVFISRQQDAWAEDDRALLQQVANLVALAVDNVINFETARAAEIELKRRLEHLRLLLGVGKSISSHLDLRNLIEVISESLRQVIHCDAVWMALCDSDPGYLRVYALDSKFRADAQAGEGRLISLEDTPAQRAMGSQQTLMLTQSDYEASSNPVIRGIAAQSVRSGCLAPLISHGQALGVISMVSLREAAFTQEDADLLTQIASLIAIAVENALNFERARAAEEQAKRQSERVQMLLEINNAVVSILDLSDLVKTISAILSDIMPHDAAGIALFEPEANHLREYTNVAYKDIDALREGETFLLEGTPAGQVFVTGQPLLIRQPDLAKYPADRYSQRPVEGTPKSACLAPLISHGRKLGIAGVSSTQVSKFFCVKKRASRP